MRRWHVCSYMQHRSKTSARFLRALAGEKWPFMSVRRRHSPCSLIRSGTRLIHFGLLLSFFVSLSCRHLDGNLHVVSWMLPTKRRTGASYWSVVDQGDLHHGLENPVLNLLRGVAFLDFAVKALIQPPSLIAVQSSMEIWLVALFGIRKQSELRDYASPSEVAGSVLDRHAHRKGLRHGCPARSSSSGHPLHRPTASISESWMPIFLHPSRCRPEPWRQAPGCHC